MFEEYYGPTIEAEREINSLLNIKACGKEQDWEIEFANPAMLDEMLAIFEEGGLGLETLSALALLIVSSLEEADERNILRTEHVQSAMEAIARVDEVRNRMKYYWLDLDRANNKSLVRRIVSSIS